jgi:hypothetical protein
MVLLGVFRHIRRMIHGFVISFLRAPHSLRFMKERKRHVVYTKIAGYYH